MKQKIKHILIPSLVLSAGAVIIYTLLDWLLIIKFHVFDIDQEWVNLWIPFIIAILLSLAFIRPRLRILVKRKKGDFKSGFIVFASLAIAAPMIPAQMYLESSTGKLSALHSIKDINPNATTEYYTVAQHFAAKSEAGVYYSSDVSGRYNENLDLNIYFATPIYDGSNHAPKSDSTHAQNDGAALILVDGVKTSKQELSQIPPDSVESVKVLKGAAVSALYGSAVRAAVIVTLKHPVDLHSETMGSPVGGRLIKKSSPGAWLCVSYHKTISNHLSRTEKEEKFHAFFDESADNFNSRNLDAFVYLRLIPHSSNQKAYQKAVKSLDNFGETKDPILLEPEFTPFSERNGSTFPWIFGWFAICGLVLFLLLLIPKTIDQPSEVIPLPAPVLKKEGNTLIDFLKPKKGYYITPVLININLAIFLAMALSGSGFLNISAQNLILWGGNYTPLTANGQWWRLLSSMFLHGGLMHVLVNMYALMVVGVMLEPMLGKNRYLISYLAAGITGSIVSTLTHKATVSVGASGAIFGLYGIFLALMLTNVFPKKVKGSFLSAVVLMIVMTFINGLGGGVDNSAHVGGLLAGVIIGLVLSPQLKRETEEAKAQVVV